MTEPRSSPRPLHDWGLSPDRIDIITRCLDRTVALNNDGAYLIKFINNAVVTLLTPGVVLRIACSTAPAPAYRP